MARAHPSMDNDGLALRAPTLTVSQVPARATHSTTQATKVIPPALNGDCTYKVHSVEEGKKYRYLWTVFILEQVPAGSVLEASKYQVLEAPF